MKLLPHSPIAACTPLLSLFLTLLSFRNSSFGQSPSARVVYSYPFDGAKDVSLSAPISIRMSVEIDPSAVSGAFHVIGERSGAISGRIALADDRRTLVFLPRMESALGERVTVRLSEAFGGSSFSYHTAERVGKLSNSMVESELGPWNRTVADTNQVSDTLVKIVISHNDHPTPGKIFVAPFSPDFSKPIQTHYLMVLDDSSNVYWSKSSNSRMYDFKLQPNGLVTYYDGDRGLYYAMDSTLTIVDSFAMVGYTTDLHELQLLPNGHALLMSYDGSAMRDLRSIGGLDSVQIVDVVLQELDGQKLPVFTWKGLDHFQVSDTYEKIDSVKSLDYVHSNAFRVDDDGNYLLSSRHLCEATKIDSKSGDVMWRFGGKNNQFAFRDDTMQFSDNARRFSYQHDVHRLPNGNILMFDNGNNRTPFVSRTLEWKLDELEHTAKLVWDYHNDPLYIAGAMGSAQRLTNGNTLIGWGFSTNGLSVSEITPERKIAYQMVFTGSYVSYRAFKFDFEKKEAPPKGVASMPRAQFESRSYPNPFNPFTTINFTLTERSHVKLDVFDQLGRQVRTIHDGVLDRGRHDILFAATGLAPGAYTYQLAAGSKVTTGRMVLAK